MAGNIASADVTPPQYRNQQVNNENTYGVSGQYDSRGPADVTNYPPNFQRYPA